MTKQYNNSILTGLLITELLLSMMCAVHLFAFITYLFHAELSPYLFPAAVVAAISLHFLFAGKLKIDIKPLVLATLFSVLALAASLAVGWFYFDLSWDGQWYHQAAVYNLGGNWNPIYQPMETPDHINNTSILYFPKNSWLFGAALLRLFGTVETGKAYNAVLLFAGVGVVYALCRDFKMPKGRALLLTALVLLNPVVWSELSGYLNDGDLYLLLVVYLASVILWLRDPKPIFILIGLMAVVCLVNTKFTGLVFFLISSFFVLIYILARERRRIKPFLLSHLLSGVLAVFVFGFNPYVTNMLNRGNPLYPLMGSKAYPSVFAGGKDSNEKGETPHNMMGKSLPVRMFYANFGRPGNAPYNKELTADLANPLTTSPATWIAYDFQETRVGGFGPYFGMVLILMLIALPVLLIACKGGRWAALIFFAGLVCCLSVSKHFWWPRFFPMLWLAPLVPLFLIWADYSGSLVRHKATRWLKAIKVYGWLLAIIIAGNGLIVACVHMQWETTSSITLRTQLTRLRDDKRPIEVDYGVFKRSMEEKLNRWDIKFTPVRLKKAHATSHKLMSVVNGYPNAVWYCQD